MEAAWIRFERNVEPVFKKFGVEVLHAISLHNTKGDFKLLPRPHVRTPSRPALLGNAGEEQEGGANSVPEAVRPMLS